MEEALIEFKKNYSSLISKIDTEEISDRDYEALVSFCALLRSDDLELYNEYKSKYRNLTDDFLIYFFAKRYNLDPEKQLSDILRNIGDTKKAKSSFISVFETLDIESQISPFEVNNKDKISANNITGKIEFKNVYFSYPTKPDQIVLKNISFIINPGQKVGLVGLSGSGKSSIIQLIERFYDANEGEILIDDINIKEYNLFELRKKIGLVSQEPTIFKRNVYENILYGNLESNFDSSIILLDYLIQ